MRLGASSKPPDADPVPGGYPRTTLPSENERVEANDVIEALGLIPHPEGGHYLETWADRSSSAIYFLLQRHEESAWHRVHDRAEIWHFYAGAPVALEVNPLAPSLDGMQIAVVGGDLLSGQRPQAVVPASAWQRARSLGEWSLVGCTVAPPFTFDAFELSGPQRGA